MRHISTVRFLCHLTLKILARHFKTGKVDGGVLRFGSLRCHIVTIFARGRLSVAGGQTSLRQPLSLHHLRFSGITTTNDR